MDRIPADIDVPLTVSFVASIAAVVLLIIVMSLASSLADARGRHAAAMAGRDRTIAELQGRQGRSQARLRQVAQQLARLETTVHQIESQGSDGVSHLRLDEQGRLVEEQ